MSYQPRHRRPVPMPNNKLPHVKLYRACKNSNVEKAKIALNDGADPNYIDQEGRPILLIAYACGDRVTKLLINHPNTNINVTDGEGKSLLHHAATYGSIKIVDNLARKGATLDLLDKDGFSPIYYAITNNHLDIVECLLNYHTPVNKNDIDSYILEIKDPRKQSGVLFDESLFDDEIVEELYTSDRLKIFEKMIKAYQPKPVPIINLIEYAVNYNNILIFDYLNNRYPDEMKKAIHTRFEGDEILLHFASGEYIARQLLLGGADVNARNKLGDVPIQYNDEESLDLIELYLEFGADLSIITNDGITVKEELINASDKIAEIIEKHCEKEDLKEPDN